MTHNEVINEWNGRKVGDGECVIWAAQYACERYGVCYLPTPVTGGARDIWEKNTVGAYFDRVSTGIPPQGAIIIWGKGLGNYYGHIAIVDSANAGSFISYDANWSGKAVTRINHNYNNVLGWLVPKGDNMALADKNAYYLGANKKVYAGLSSIDEAKATIGNLKNKRVLYANDFIKLKGSKKVYQAVSSGAAFKIIGGDWNKIKEINISTQLLTEDDITFIKKIQAWLGSLVSRFKK